MKYFSNRVN